MTFTVLWTPPALDQLTAVWLNAADQAAVTAASHRIDQALARQPIGVGEGRGGADRMLFDPPLWVYYRVVLDDVRVEVIDVGSAKG